MRMVALEAALDITIAALNANGSMDSVSDSSCSNPLRTDQEQYSHDGNHDAIDPMSKNIDRYLYVSEAEAAELLDDISSSDSGISMWV